MKWQEFLYLANIIDYFRILSLYWAVRGDDPVEFAQWYAFSYILDAFDGYAARALNQESRLGYYLDMVIDRVSSCLCLHYAAQAVIGPGSFIPSPVAGVVALTLRSLIVLVEVVSHAVVMYLSEVRGVHQKQMGYQYAIVRLYLGDKRFLSWACFSFEGFGLGLIVGSVPLALVSLPGFVFRALANLARLLAVVSRGENMLWPGCPDDDGEVPCRGSSDRLGHHRAASPKGAQVIGTLSGKTDKES